MTNQKKITIRIKTSMPRSNLWDCSGAYITVKGNITVTDPDKAKSRRPRRCNANAQFA